jgi:hypothetical protein
VSNTHDNGFPVKTTIWTSELLEERREQVQRLAAFVAAKSRGDKKAWTYLQPGEEEIEAKFDVAEDIRERGVDQPGQVLKTMNEEKVAAAARRKRLAEWERKGAALQWTQSHDQLARSLGAEYSEDIWWVGGTSVDGTALLGILADDTLTDDQRKEWMDVLAWEPVPPSIPRVTNDMLINRQRREAQTRVKESLNKEIRARGVDQPGEVLKTLNEEKVEAAAWSKRRAEWRRKGASLKWTESLAQRARRLGASYSEDMWWVRTAGVSYANDGAFLAVVADDTLTDDQCKDAMERLAFEWG